MTLLKCWLRVYRVLVLVVSVLVNASNIAMFRLSCALVRRRKCQNSPALGHLVPRVLFSGVVILCMRQVHLYVCSCGRRGYTCCCTQRFNSLSPLSVRCPVPSCRVHDFLAVIPRANDLSIEISTC